MTTRQTNQTNVTESNQTMASAMENSGRVEVVEAIEVIAQPVQNPMQS